MVLLKVGTGSLKWEVIEKSGHEKNMQVNLLSPALLALELLPTLEKTARLKGVPSQMSWVGSFVQFDHTLDKKPIRLDRACLPISTTRNIGRLWKILGFKTFGNDFR